MQYKLNFIRSILLYVLQKCLQFFIVQKITVYHICHCSGYLIEMDYVIGITLNVIQEVQLLLRIEIQLDNGVGFEAVNRAIYIDGISLNNTQFI